MNKQMELPDNILQKYDATTQSFYRQMSYKIEKLIDTGRIQKKTDDNYICLPTQGYNKTTYNLYKVEDRWICNCQGFRKRGICTHTTALLAILN